MSDPVISGLLDMDAEPVRDFFRHAPVMMHAIDDGGRIIAVSRYWASRLGYSPDEMIGRKSIDFVTPESRELAVKEVLPRFFEEGEVRRQPYDFVRKDGSVLPILLSAITLKNPDGGTGSGLAFMVEDDDRDLLHRDLQSALLRAERANDAKAQFLTAMSHELRTPMNAILGFAQLLKMTDLSTKQSAHVEAILASGRQLMVRLSELLDLAQLEFSDFKVTQRATSTEALLAPVLTAWAPTIEAKGLVFSRDIAPDFPARLTVDTDRVRQILTHFLSNALLHTETGSISLGARLLSCSGSKARIEFSVRDTGPGVDHDLLGHLFERFSDKEPDFTKAGGGWGIGLSICRALADAMSAEVGVESERSTGGANFYLVLNTPCETCAA